MQDQPEIAEITRTYGGMEGRRIKAGTRLAIDKEIEGLQVISLGRYRQLVQAGLARPWTGSPIPPSAAPRPAYAAAGQTVKQPIQTASRSVKQAQAKAAKRKNAEAPPEPRPLVNTAGGQTGPSASSSLSPEDQASKKASLGLRGTRTSKRSPSTTPSASSPGPAPSTPATAPGGASTKAPKGSKA